MSRFEFYSKCIICVIIGSASVYFSANAQEMSRKEEWVVYTLIAIILWRDDWTFLPKSWSEAIERMIDKHGGKS